MALLANRTKATVHHRDSKDASMRALPDGYPVTQIEDGDGVVSCG